MGGQAIAVILIVGMAVAYLLWRFVGARRPGAKAQGGCGCCAATCAARQIGEKQQNATCTPTPAKSPTTPLT